MFIFVDESGDLGTTGGTKYFIIGMVFYYEKSVSEIDKVINVHNKYMWVHGWPRASEIKATNLYNYRNPEYKIDCSKLTVNPKLYLQEIYRDINKMNIKAGFIIHEPSKQGPILRCLHKEKAYNFLSKNLYLECFSFLGDTMEICVDQRNIALIKKQKNVDLSTQGLNLDYIGYIKTELAFQFASKRQIQPAVNICFENSKRIRGLQVADYLVWAIRKKFEGKLYWYNLLERIEKIEKIDNF